MRHYPYRLITFFSLAWGTAGGGLALADQLHNSYTQVVIKFSEPVVSLTTVQNQHQASAKDADRGVDLFDVTGDPAHPPKAQWQDQDTLVLTYPLGSASSTEYCLRFKPGVQYLSKRPLARYEYRFRRPSEGYLQAQALEGTRDSVLVSGNLHAGWQQPSWSREMMDFGSKSPVRYRFRQCIRHAFGAVTYGKEVPATVRSSTLADGLTSAATNLLLFRHFEDWAKLTPASLLPGQVVVTPQEPLDPAFTWELLASAEANQGFAAGQTLLSGLKPQPELLTTLQQAFEDGKRVLSVGYAAAVSAQDMQDVFGRMQLTVDGQQARLNDDRTSWTVTTQGQTYTFRFKEAIVHDKAEAVPVPAFLNGEGEQRRRIAYKEPNAAYGFTMEVDGGTLPVVLDVTLPAGTTAKRGLRQAQDHTHRITLNPAAPLLRAGATPTVLPLRGERKLRFDAVNLSALSVTARRWDAEAAAIKHNMISQCLINDTENRNALYLLRLMEERTKRGLRTEGMSDEQLRRYAQQIKEARKRNAPIYRDAVLAGTTVYPTQELSIALPAAPANAQCLSSEVELDLDTLAGGHAQPGLYLISVTAKPTPAVVAALKALNLPEDALNATSEYLVQLTDLQVCTGNGGYSVTRLADGSPVQNAVMRFFTRPQQQPRKAPAQRRPHPAVMPVRPQPEGSGLTLLEESGTAEHIVNGILLTDRKAEQLLVQAGEDYALVQAGGYYYAPNGGEQHVALNVKDRSLYRPGDTVYLRSILRSVNNDNQVKLPGSAVALLTVRRPNGEELLSRQIPLGAYGAFETSFTLPKGEEDVTGNYQVFVRTPDNRFQYSDWVNCQVFRRDALEAQVDVEVEQVSPRKAVVKVSAKDLNGAIPEGAKLDLSLNLPKPPVLRPLVPQGTSPMPITPRRGAASTGTTVALSSTENTKPETAPKAEGQKAPFCLTENETEVRKYNAVLDAQGEAELTLALNPLGNRSSGFHFSVYGSLTNDREESLTLQHVSKNLTPGNIILQLEADRLKVLKSTDRGIYDKEQAVHVQIINTVDQEDALPNGFTLSEPKPVCVWEQDITVPAGCDKGVQLPLEKLYAELNTEKRRQGSNLTVQMSALDAEGRMVCERSGWYRWWRRTEEMNYVAARFEQNAITMDATFEADGTAMAIVGSGNRQRSMLLPVKAGKQTLSVAVQPEEGGNMTVTIFQLRPGKHGTYDRMSGVETSCAVPPTDKRMKVELSLPQQPSLPGSTLSLSGTVLLPNGQPAPAVEVTFYAVDAGMLSVSGYQAADPLAFFYRASARSFSPRVLFRMPEEHDAQPQPAPTPRQALLPGFWLGDVVTGPGNPPYLNMYRMKMGVMPLGATHKMRMARNEDMAMQAPVAENCAVDSYGAGMMAKGVAAAAPAAPAPLLSEAVADACDGSAEVQTMAAPRLRTNFVPVAFWKGALRTNAEGRFSTELTLPDTLTTYRVFAVAIDRSGKLFGTAEGTFMVNQPVMLTPGTPLFMSLGDTLRLPLTITNHSGKEDTWTVQLEGAQAPQQIRLQAGKTGTLYFDYTAVTEGENRLHWMAQAAAGGDAVEGSFDVRFPAPVLRESHRLVLQPGAAAVELAKLPAPELANSERGRMTVELSANPLLHLAGCADYVLGYPYGCTEQTASGLLPYLLYDRLAPFCPKMAQTPADQVAQVVQDSIAALFERQLDDGGLGYWPASQHSMPWASAYAGLIMTIASENGHSVPQDKMEKLRDYLRTELNKDEARRPGERIFCPMSLYAIGRTLGDDALVMRALSMARRDVPEQRPPFAWRNRALPDLQFICTLRRTPEARHDAFLKWMRSRGHDYRHNTTWQSGWTLIALSEYLRMEPADAPPARVRLDNRQELTLNNGITRIQPLFSGRKLASATTTLTSVEGPVYVTVKVRALPDQTEFPGITEKGLQITRLYEKKGEDGIWRPGSDFAVGDVVRVTLTCAKMADELEYFVLEDYLPSSMEAINPNVPSQAAGLEPLSWSLWFDHREFLADRVRGFCTRWAGRDVLNMRYYARVKRAGTATAPPASAQLMYEPQTYGLSENCRFTTK